MAAGERRGVAVGPALWVACVPCVRPQLRPFNFRSWEAPGPSGALRRLGPVPGGQRCVPVGLARGSRCRRPAGFRATLPVSFFPLHVSSLSRPVPSSLLPLPSVEARMRSAVLGAGSMAAAVPVRCRFRGEARYGAGR